jgi:hypothetical protein
MFQFKVYSPREMFLRGNINIFSEGGLRTVLINREKILKKYIKYSQIRVEKDCLRKS